MVARASAGGRRDGRARLFDPTVGFHAARITPGGCVVKTLLLIPSYAKTGIEPAVQSDSHPMMDYEALRRALCNGEGHSAELVDYAAIDASGSAAVRLVKRLFGANAALAVVGFLRRGEFHTVFTNAEVVALPLALLFKLVRRRPRHVTIGHRLSADKKRPFFTLLRVHEQIDAILVYASTQREYALKTLGVPEHVLRLIPFHADHRFFRPLSHVTVDERQVCSAGLEWRDYPTLIEAVADATDLSVRLAAASPWSKHSNETASRRLPAHVEARRYDYEGLRQLYAQSAVVVVPLYENDFQAGITTLLEAMAMGKPVVVTATTGQCDVIVDGDNGMYVAPGSAAGWRTALAQLQRDPALRQRLGAAARRWVENNATLDLWVRNVVAAIRGEPSPVTGFGVPSGPGLGGSAAESGQGIVRSVSAGEVTEGARAGLARYGTPPRGAR
jgi:glycosyltransferase involved in cell wall biosynthesis